MRASHIALGLAALSAVALSTAAVAGTCYVIVDRANDVTYQGTTAPVDLSDEGAAARNAMRAQGQQLIAMEAETCPAIDRGRPGARSGPASVEEIVSGMRSAMPYGTPGRPATAAAADGISLPTITVPRATGGGMSVGGPPSGMSIR